MTNTLYFQAPDFCPACSHPLTEDGSFLFCRNLLCGAKSTGNVKVWVSRLGLLHWGDAIIENLTRGDEAPVKELADLYDLSLEDLAVASSGLKMAKKCHDTLHSAKEMTFETFLSSLNISNLGISTATDLVQNGICDVDMFCSVDIPGLENIPNIGKKSAESIYNQKFSRQEEIRNLASRVTIKRSTGGVLSGKSFCITGSTTIPRKALQKKISDNGGIVKESVVSGLSYLITNEDRSTFTSDKIKKAQKYGVTVITEVEFTGMVGQ
jgi:DNA ligase (NAD+)